MREALILAGGLATRLGDLALSTPKSLQPVAGRPFLEHIAWNLARHGVTRVVLSLGRLADAFDDVASSGLGAGLDVAIVVEPEPLGTGGAIALAARGLTSDEVLVLNGDTLFDLNYLDIALLRRESGAPVAVALRAVEDSDRFGAVALHDTRVTAFAEKGSIGPGLVSGGVYAAETEFLRALTVAPHSFETDVLAPLAAEGRLAGREYPGYFIDIGVPDSLEVAQTSVAAWRAKPLMIFDRDGVLNVDHGHVGTPERFEWVPGAPEAVRAVNDAGFLAAVVTNQAGIAKGYYSESEYRAFERWIAARLADHGAHVDAVYHCPHHPDAEGEYGVACDCRKPAPGMILAALRDLGPDRSRVMLIGDKDTDRRAAEAAGVGWVLFDGADLPGVVRSVIERFGGPA